MTPLNSFASSLCDLRTPLPTKQPPPQQTTWNGDGDGGDENDDASVSSTTTWDSTFQYSTAATSTTTAGEGATTTTTDTVGCLCPVAVSDGLYLYGGVWQRRASDASRDPGCWWTWEQDLASSGSVAVNPSSTGIRITSMASNASGTVLAAATNAGTVSLLRAADGAILASRQVVVASNANNNNPMASVLSSPINLVWISSPNRINNDTAAADDDASFGGNENDDDILMIEIPYSDCEEEEDLDDTTDGAATVRLPHLILASSIRGPCLNAPFSNDTNAAHHKVAEAAKAMQIWGLTEEEAIVRDMKKNWMALTACRHRCSTSSSVDSTIVRLVACDRDGSLALWDCDCRQQTATLVQANLSLHYDDSTISTSNETNETRTTINDGGGDNFMIDFEVGLYTQCTTLSYGLPHSFVVCAAVVPEAPPLLLWIDPWNRKTACHMELPPDTSSASAGMWPSAAAIGSRTTTPNNNTKVLALEPVAAWNAVDAIAVAVAVKISSRDGGGSGEIFVHVLQVLVEHGGLAESDDSVRLLSPHIVYTIPICNDAMSLGLASILTGSSNIAGSTAPYSFRCQLVGTNSGSNTSYTANQKCTVSYKEFQPNPGTSSTVGQIRSLLGRNQFDAADKLLARADEQKQAWVRDSYANFVPSEIALKRLQHVVALTSDHREISNALEHAQSCLRQLASGAVTSDWGDRGICLFVDAVDLVSQSPSSLSCEQFCKGLQALVASIIFVAERVPLEQGEKLVAKKDAIANRIAALEFLASVSEHSRPTTPFHTIRSPRHLYIVLVREQNFSLAEALCRSKLRHQITPEILVAPILKINAAGNVQPQKYLSLLSNIVIPALAVNDEYFSQVKIWCCSLADDMDASNHERLSLNDAIDLLQVKC